MNVQNHAYGGVFQSLTVIDHVYLKDGMWLVVLLIDLTYLNVQKCYPSVFS